MARADRILAVALTLALGLAGAAAAQFYVAYEKGLAAAAAGDWAAALGELEQAERMEPRAQARVRTYGSRFLFAYDPGFHRARCLAELGRYDEAAELLAEADRAGVTPPAERAALARRLQQLRAASPAPAPAPTPVATARPLSAATPTPPAAAPPAPARLRIESQPAGAAARLDGRSVGATPVEVATAPGAHRLELARDGFETWTQEVAAVAGETRTLEVALRPAPVASAPVATSTPVPTPAPTPTPAPATVRFEPAPVEPAPRAAETVSTPPQEPAVDGEGPPRAAWLAAGAALAAALAAGAGWALRRRRDAAPELGSGWVRRLPSGGRLGRYRVVAELGRGGMATTFRAVRRGDGLEVAVKIPHPSGDPAYLERFLREGRLGETLHHPAIVRILEAGEEEGIPYLAMELIPGETLRERLDRSPGGLPEPEALAIARAVAEALDYAHGKGVVHRDLKPENIMLTPAGPPKVMDFGVARVEGQPGLTTSHLFFGSPLYGAPELVEPRSIDRRADLYSLGVILFEMLEGRPPFVHEAVMKLIEMHQRAPLPDPATLPRPIAAPLWRLLARLLEKDREARYPSAQALLVDLRRVADAALPD